MFLSNLQFYNLLSVRQCVRVLVCIPLFTLEVSANSLDTAPYILGRVRAQAPLYEDLATDQMLQLNASQQEEELYKAYVPSVEFNVEILCKWRGYFRVKILTGENSYLLRQEDVLFLGENLTALNDLSWRAVVREELKGLSANDPLLLKIATCGPEERDPAPAPAAKEEQIIASAEQKPKSKPVGVTRGGESPSKEKEEFTYGLHEVKSGESLWKIAKTYRLNPLAIKDLNEMSSYKVEPGQVLRIPRNNSKKSVTYYRVKPGETLWRIAFNHSTSVEELKIVNHLQSNTIISGQKLAIPLD